MNKSAEALRDGAVIATSKYWGSKETGAFDTVVGAIDLAIAARAVEVAEGMHEAGCYCGGATFMANPADVLAHFNAGGTVENFADPRCTEARARLRAEVERLTK